MTKALRLTLTTLILIVTVFVLAGPTTALAEGNGRVTRANLTAEIVITREDGRTLTVDYDGVLTLATRGNGIVIDVSGAGIVRETAERVLIDITSVGVTQRAGNQVRFAARGLFAVERANGNRVLIDIVSAGVVQQQGSDITLNFSSNGVVRGSGENIVIDVIHAGVRAG
jgi:hypothetical protein